MRDKAWFFAVRRHDGHQRDRTQVGDGTSSTSSFEIRADPRKINFQPGQQAPDPAHRHRGADRTRSTSSAELRRQWTRCDCTLDENLSTADLVVRDRPTDLPRDQGRRRSEDATFREPLTHPITPGASPESPPGNNFRYQDLSSGCRYNCLGQAARAGYIDCRANRPTRRCDLFRGDHELKFGADYQDVTSTTSTTSAGRSAGGDSTPASPAASSRRRTSGSSPPSAVETTTEIDVGLRAGPIRPRLALQPLRRRPHGRPGVRQRRRPGGDVRHRVRAAPGGDLRRRRRRASAAQGHRGPLLPGASGRTSSTRSTPPSRTATTSSRSSVEPGDPALRRRSQRTMPLARLRSGDVRSLLQGRGEPRPRLAVRPAWAFKPAVHVVGDRGICSGRPTSSTPPEHRCTDVRNWDDGDPRVQGLSPSSSIASFHEGWTVRSNYTWATARATTSQQ